MNEPADANIDLLTLLPENARRGSKPRCHGLTHGPAEAVAQRLTQIIAPHGHVAATDKWMPEGFTQTDEAEFHKATRLLREEDCAEVRRWWFAISRGGQQRSPNFDIASTCTVGHGSEAKRGILLVEAKAHEDELRTEEKGKRSPESDGEKVNHEHIGNAIRAASEAFAASSNRPWSLSHEACYQMANRFALAWKLTALGYPVILVYLGFQNASEMAQPIRTSESWETLVKSHGASPAGTPIPPEIWNHSFLLNGQPFVALIKFIDCPLRPV